MKLLVCDVEGTIFKPHMIKSSLHASYIWTKIAATLGKDAEKEEIITQKKWRDNDYGFSASGQAYMNWVKDTIKIHKKHGLTKEIFDNVINSAEYVDGAEEFFKRLNRKEYIPVLISGGIQNLSFKACEDLNIEKQNSFSSCEYFFDNNGKVDENLTFLNTSNFFGKHEMVKIVLRKYGLNSDDWIFIGDGINDVGIALDSPISIGIDPIKELAKVIDYSYIDFYELMNDPTLLEKERLII
ncbi:MAG: HAD family hydrolase [Sedimentibacter sp.]